MDIGSSLTMSGALSGATTIDCSSTLTVTGGAIKMAGSPANGAGSDRYLSGAGGATDFVANMPTGGAWQWLVNNSLVGYINASNATLNVPLVFASPAPAASPTLRAIHTNGSATDLYENIPTGGTYAWTIAGTTKATISSATLALSSADLRLLTGFGVRTNTSDGSDNAQIFVGAGSAAGDTRGATVYWNGNEHATLPGVLNLTAGDVAGGGNITLTTHAIERLKIAYDGAVTGGIVNAASGLCGLDSSGKVAAAQAPAFSGVVAYTTTDQGSLSADTYNKITFGTERLDPESAFATSTYTAPRTGVYRINLNAAFASNAGAATDVVFVVYVNGSRVATTARKYRNEGSSLINTYNPSWVLSVTSGQTVEIYEQHEDNTGTIYGIETVSGNSDTGGTELTIQYVGS
jgi:hypothetical protein